MLRRSSRGSASASVSATAVSSSVSSSSMSYSSSSKVSSSSVSRTGGTAVEGSRSVTRSAVSGGHEVGMRAGESHEVSKSFEMSTDTAVEKARLRLRPITAARASIMFGRSAGGSSASASTAMVPYGGGGGSMTTRSHTSAEARQLAMHLEGVIDERQKAKSDLWELNERLADYVEKTRFLEAQNRRLVSEADILKSGFSSESVTLKARYQVEIEELQRLIDESEARRHELEKRVEVVTGQHESFTFQLTEIEEKHESTCSTKEHLMMQLGELEGELATLRRRVGDFDNERGRYRGIIARMREEEADLRRDLDQERMVSMVAKNAATQMQDELAFVMETQTSKTTEMVGLAYRDTTEENRALWKTEFSDAFRTLHADYMTRLEEAHTEAEATFQTQVREQQTSSTKDTVEMRQLTVDNQRSKQQVDYLTARSTELTTRIAQFEAQLVEISSEKTRILAEHESMRTHLRSELDTYTHELENTRREIQTILDDKLSLEIEIASYRTLLDSEEVRIKEDIHAVIEDQRRVKEIMASRGMYESALALEGGHGGGHHVSHLGGGYGFGAGGGGGGGGYSMGGGFGMSGGASMSMGGGGGFSLGGGGGGGSSYSFQSGSYRTGGGFSGGMESSANAKGGEGKTSSQTRRVQVTQQGGQDKMDKH